MGKRKLPTYAWEPPGFENFDTIVVASNPSSPALKRHFAAGAEQALGPPSPGLAERLLGPPLTNPAPGA